MYHLPINTPVGILDPERQTHKKIRLKEPLLYFEKALILSKEKLETRIEYYFRHWEEQEIVAAAIDHKLSFHIGDGCILLVHECFVEEV